MEAGVLTGSVDVPLEIQSATTVVPIVAFNSSDPRDISVTKEGSNYRELEGEVRKYMDESRIMLQTWVKFMAEVDRFWVSTFGPGCGLNLTLDWLL
ncbi:hypothetical protein Tco_1001803 [Tanacetum coccineum]